MPLDLHFQNTWALYFPVCCDNAMGIHDVTRSLRSPTVRCPDSGSGVGREATEEYMFLGSSLCRGDLSPEQPEYVD